MAEQKKKGLVARLLNYFIRQKPEPFFATLRCLKPVLKLPGNGPVFVTRFRDVQEVLSRHEIFTVRTYAPMMDTSVGPFMLARDGTTINQRDKCILRAVLQREDLPRVRETVADLADAAIDAGAENGELEVVANLSRKVPLQLLGAYFGFPGPDLESMFRWSRGTQHDMFHNQDKDEEVHQVNLRAGSEMKAYVTQLVKQRREELKSNPTAQDAVSRLLRFSFPEELGFDEERIIINICGFLIGAGETTSAAIVQLLDQLLRRPNELEMARTAAKNSDDELLGKLCWEALRFNPINPFVARLCVEDYVVVSSLFRRTRIKAGSIVLACTRSAMMDGMHVRRPRQFRIDRPYYHYMHFGYGNHVCMGDQVSSVQIPEIVKRLLLRNNLRRADGARGELNFQGGPFPEQFWVKFDRMPPKTFTRVQAQSPPAV
jgi:cytochrome P450